jgi:hypothetical protein
MTLIWSNNLKELQVKYLFVQQIIFYLDKVREKVKKKAKVKKDFFDPSSSKLSAAKKDKTFYDMELSRPILKVRFLIST